MRPRVRLAQLYAPEWLDETLKIAARCQFSLNELRYEYPEEIVPPGATPTSHLRALTDAGALYRFPEGVPPTVRAQIEKELALVAELNYEAFFLTVDDMVRFARSQGILCQGRGSAANSAVCYCLGITEVDPAAATCCSSASCHASATNRRISMSISSTSGAKKSFSTSTTNTAAIARRWPPPCIRYRSRGACAMSARRSAFDPEQRRSGRKDPSSGGIDGQRTRAAGLDGSGLDPDSRSITQWRDLADELLGFPRHLSQHPGGFVIAATKLVATGADRKRGDARSHRHPVGQGRSRSAWPVESRCAGARHAVGHSAAALDFIAAKHPAARSRWRMITGDDTPPTT